MLNNYFSLFLNKTSLFSSDAEWFKPSSYIIHHDQTCCFSVSACSRLWSLSCCRLLSSSCSSSLSLSALTSWSSASCLIFLRAPSCSISRLCRTTSCYTEQPRAQTWIKQPSAPYRNSKNSITGGVWVTLNQWTFWPSLRPVSPPPPDVRRWPCVKTAGPPAVQHLESESELVSPSQPGPTHSPLLSADASVQLEIPTRRGKPLGPMIPNKPNKVIWLID